MPDPVPLALPLDYADCKRSAAPLYRLEDGEWQLLLREVRSDALLYVLWFMQDLELARRVMRNFSERTAAMLTEDLVARFTGHNPEDESMNNPKIARDSLRQVLEVLARLQAEDQIAKHH